MSVAICTGKGREEDQEVHMHIGHCKSCPMLSYGIRCAIEWFGYDYERVAVSSDVHRGIHPHPVQMESPNIAMRTASVSWRRTRRIEE